MYKILVLILIIAFVASAKQVSGPEIVADEVDDLLKKLLEIVTVSVENARRQFFNKEKYMNQTAAQTVATTDRFAKSWVVWAKGYVENLKYRAKEAGVNIDDCLGKDEQSFINVDASVLGEVEKVVQDLIIQMMYSINGAFIKFDKITEDVAKIKQDTEDCRKSLKSKDCLEKLAIKMKEEIVQLPKEITEESSDIIDVIQGIEQILKNAGFLRLRDAEAIGRNLMKKMTDCVDQKINH